MFKLTNDGKRSEYSYIHNNLGPKCAKKYYS
jgi:hypothetical protein